MRCKRSGRDGYRLSLPGIAGIHTRLFNETLGPVWLRKLRRLRCLRRWIDGDQRALLPLEQISCRQDILACSVEFHISLHRLESIARMKLSDQFRIIDTVSFIRRLHQNLSNSETFCYVRADAIGCPAILRQEVVNHL